MVRCALPPTGLVGAFTFTLMILQVRDSFAAAPPQYPIISGSYSASEHYTFDVDDNIYGTQVINGTGGGTVVLSQSGNRVTYQAKDGTGKITITRTGTLIGNDLTITGPAALPSAGVSYTKNTFTATGTVEDGQIVLHGTGIIVARSGKQIETIQVTSTATLTGNVTPLDIGHIQASVSPAKSGTVTGIAGSGVYPNGTSISLKANRAKGYYFVDWTEADAVLGTDLVLPLTVQDSRKVQANFAAVAAAGYAGLFQSGPDATAQSVGFCGAALSSTSAFSSSIRVLGQTFSIAGNFDESWNLSRTIARPRLSSLLVTLHLDPATRTLSGQIKTADDAFSANVNLTPLPVYTRTSPTPLTGAFNVILPPEPGSSNPTTPQGSGYLTLKVEAAGGITAAGKLPDGTAVTLSTTLANGGAIPLHKFVYVKSTQLYGCLFGTLGLHGSGAADDTCDGSMTAIKPTHSGAGYYNSTGFDADFDAVGARYKAPARGTPVLSAGMIAITDGGMTDLQAISQAITVSNLNIVSAAGQNPAKVKVTFTAVTGAFSGTFIHPSSGRSTSFSGLICQYPNAPFAAGFFLGPVTGGAGLSGSVRLAP